MASDGRHEGMVRVASRGLDLDRASISHQGCILGPMQQPQGGVPDVGLALSASWQVSSWSVLV